jgi:hypothetical protein
MIQMWVSHDRNVRVGYDSDVRVGHDRNVRVGHDSDVRVGHDRNVRVGYDSVEHSAMILLYMAVIIQCLREF